MSLGCRERFLVISTNWLELDTWCWVRPAKGRRILARYRAVLYVGEPLEATIGRRGKSGLWIFGCTKYLGQDELEGLRYWYSWMVRASARWRARSLLTTRFSMDGMGFFLRGRYELEDKMSLTLVVYWDQSMMTVELPLSAVRIWMELSCLRSRRAESSSLERLGLTGFALHNVSLICIPTSSATVVSRRLNVCSTAWIISSVGMEMHVPPSKSWAQLIQHTWNMYLVNYTSSVCGRAHGWRDWTKLTLDYTSHLSFPSLVASCGRSKPDPRT